MNEEVFGNQRSAESNWALAGEIWFMLDLMQVAEYASICKQVVYRTNACAVREAERTLKYQQFVLS